MATKRTPLRRDARARLTPELVALWRNLRAIKAAGDHEEFEPLGRRREYLNASGALNRALGVKPWEAWVIDPESPKAPPYMHHNPIALEGWRKAWEWRCELEAAAR